MTHAQAFSLWSSVHSRGELSAPEAASEWRGASPSRRVLFSDVYASPKRGTIFNRTWSTTDAVYVAFMVLMHAGCLLAPATFSLSSLACFAVMYFVTGCIGITFSFHRQLSHKGFKLPKVLEYAAAYCGALAVQGDPIEWVSSHRYHHLHTDTPLDPHSPYEGFWWSPDGAHLCFQETDDAAVPGVPGVDTPAALAAAAAALERSRPAFSFAAWTRSRCALLRAAAREATARCAASDAGTARDMSHGRSMSRR
jgi:hypothetical protein